MSPEKAAKQAANVLMLAYRDTGPDERSEAVLQSAHSVRRAPSGHRFLLKSDALIAIGKAARRLVPLIDFYPLEKCIDELSGYVVGERDAGTPLEQVHNRLREKVLQYLKRFANLQGDWEAVYAVRNIDPNEGPFTIGPCHFYLMDDEQFALWGQRFATGRYDPPRDAPSLQSWRNHEAALRGQVVAAARVRAVDQEHARAKGRSRIEETINILRYGQLAIGFPDRFFPEIGLWNRQYQHDQSIVIRLDKLDTGTQWSGGGPLGNQISISRRAPGWDGLDQLARLDLAGRNELQLRLTTALEWIGQAAVAPSAPIRLVALVTGLEALLIEESETAGKKPKLARRVSRLIARSDQEAETVAKEVEGLYKVRSECVHAGLMDVEKDEISRAVQIVTKVVASLFTRPPFCTAQCINDLRKHVDQPTGAEDSNRTNWIADNAFFRWMNEGCPRDRQLQHWLDAEREYICNLLLKGRPLTTFSDGRQPEPDEEVPAAE